MRRRFAAILSFFSIVLLVGTCAAWLLSTRRFAPYAACTFYDQRNLPYRWFKTMGLPSGLVLRIDQARPARDAPAPAAERFNAMLWKVSPGEGRVFDQPAEWAGVQFRRLDQPYRDYLTHRLLLPWWLLLLLFAAAPAWWIFVRLRRTHRADRGRCPECGEDLRQAFDTRCPKCGTAMAEIMA